MGCFHEDEILYGLVVLQDGTTKVSQVQCGTCRAYGTITAYWNEGLEDYEENAYYWHSESTYRRMQESEV